ncbi:hypothetical protein D1BOALGB6SA_3440 [Olavius sp. associated proteobacterium Delta 1]|nr:hypothetical protein D1BOALGB6SA_3440 [Olavius sp. associated proteobacterium Delta 1]
MIFPIEGDRRQASIVNFGDVEEIKRPFGKPFGLKPIGSDRRGEGS